MFSSFAQRASPSCAAVCVQKRSAPARTSVLDIGAIYSLAPRRLYVIEHRGGGPRAYGGNPSTKDRPMNEYLARMETQLKKWDADLEVLAAEGQKASAAARIAYDERIKQLRASR